MAPRLRSHFPPGEVRMGRILVPVMIDSFLEPGCSVRCEALVDTGAAFDPIGCEVIFVGMPEEAEPLIGYLTLEQAGLVVDMAGHRLVKVPYFDPKGARAA